MDLSFDIPLPSPPSREAQQAWARDHLDLGEPFALPAWPAALQAEIPGLSFVGLHPELLGALLRRLYAVQDGQDFSTLAAHADDAVWAQGMATLDALIAQTERRAFVRLGTRSAKDAFIHLDDWDRPLPMTSAADAMERLMASMERIPEDLAAAELLGRTPVLAVRPFVDSHPREEFRLFIEAGHLVGISQYFYRHAFEGMAAFVAQVEPALRAYATHIQTLAPWPSFTLDVWAREDGSVQLIEVNPPVSGGRTDPALFADQSLEGQLLWRDGGDRVA